MDAGTLFCYHEMYRSIPLKGDETLNRAYSVRALTEGAMMTGIFALMALITYYSPLGTILLFAMSAPTAILTMRQGWKVGLLSSLASILLLLLLLDPLFVLTGCITLQFTGLTLGVAIKKQWNPWQIVLVTSVSCLLGFLFLIVMSSVILDVNFTEEMIEMYRQASLTSLDLANQFNLPADQTTLIQQIPDMIEVYFTTLFPLLMILSSIINAMLNYQVMVILGRRLNFSVHRLPPFQTWRLPDLFGLVYMVAFLLNWFGSSQGIPLLKDGANNLYQLFYLLMQVQGISLATWFLLKWNVSHVFRWLILLFFYFNPYLGFLSILLGFADLFMDFRRLTPRRQLPVAP